MVFKPTIRYFENGRETVKGNVDAELVLHAAAIEYSNYDKAIIVSGDGDFACLIQFLEDKDKLLRIFTPNTKYSKLLRPYSRHIVRILYALVLYFGKMACMNENGLTSEFSICLTPDHAATQAVEAIRKTLPPSPYRDDTPHITILRTIKTPLPMSDKDLLEDMRQLLELSKDLPLSATVRKPANSFEPLFRWFSSQLIIHHSPEIELCRKHILRILQASNYSVGIVSRLTFFPHISVRLGVPYTEEARVIAERNFAPGTKLTFNKWIILRDMKKDGRYLVREIAM